MKIIQVLTDTNVGGAGSWLMNFLKCFRCNGYELLVVLPENAALTQPIRDFGVKVKEVKGIADKSFSIRGYYNLKKLFEYERPTIIHSHACLSARLAARKCKRKIINTRHCLEEPKKGIKRLISSFLNNYLSDLIIGVSEATCQNLIDCGVDEKKIRLVYNSIFPIPEYDPEKRFLTREKYGIGWEACIVGIVARLEDEKNHRLFLDAAKLILKEEEHTFFLVVGGGSKEEELKAYAKELGIENRILFTGHLDDVTEMMNIMEIITLTSKKEALSLALLEAMTLSLPAVSTDSGGPNEVIEDGVTGYIVENYNPQAFADAVVKLIRDPDLRDEMGVAGEKRARTVFSPERMIFTLDRIYNKL